MNRGLARLVAAAIVVGVLGSGPRSAADEAPTYADRSRFDLEEPDRSSALMVDPVSIARGLYAAEGDFVLGRRVSLAVEGGLGRNGGRTQAALGAALFVYPLRVALHGFYLAPRLGYVRPLDEPLATVGGGAQTLFAAVTTGWQWTWDYGLSLRLGVGAAVFSSLSAPPGVERLPLSARVAMVTDSALGWAW